MGDIAKCSVGKPHEYYNEELLYKLFGVNAELLIDHAWGWEPCTIKAIKEYKPESNSISSGQVLQKPYTAEKARLVVLEMTDLLVLDLVDKNLCTDQIILNIGYDSGNEGYDGESTTDRYGRSTPKPVRGTGNLRGYTSSTKEILQLTGDLYDRIINPKLLIRRINVTACHVIDEKTADEMKIPEH